MEKCFIKDWQTIKKEHIDTKVDHIPVTGRSFNYYLKALFPDFIDKKQVLKYIDQKKFLDVGSGINHLRKDSLLYLLIKNKNIAYGLDIEKLPKHKNYIQKSIFDTKLKNNYYDFITINNLLYFHLYKSSQIKKALIEMHRILKSGGEMRIFPIFYGNYYYGNKKLRNFINKLFFVRILEPKTIPKENPIFYIDNEIVESKSVGSREIKLMKKLESYVVIFKKI